MNVDSTFNAGAAVPEGVVAVSISETDQWVQVASWPQTGSYATVYASNSSPTGGDGVDGDFWFETDNASLYNLYVKEAGTWLGFQTFAGASGAPTNPSGGEDYYVQIDTSPVTGNGDVTAVYQWLPVSSVSDGDGIVYNAGTQQWEESTTIAHTDRSNSFTASGQTIAGDDPAEAPLTITGAPAQTANLLVVEDNSGTDRFTISDTGYTTTANVQAAGGVRVGTAVTYSTNQKWLSIDNAASTPSTVSNGAIVYAAAGEVLARTAGANVGLTAKRVAVKTAAHTFEAADQGAIVVLNSSSNFNFELPTDATTNFPVGTVILVATQSTGHMTVTAAAGATVTGTTVLNTAGTIATVIKVAANTWLCHH